MVFLLFGRSVEQWSVDLYHEARAPARASPSLPRPLPGHLRRLRATAGRGLHGVLELITVEPERPPLLGPFPVRKQRVLDVKGDRRRRRVDGVAAEVGVGPLHRGAVLLGSPLALVASGEMG